MSFGRHSLFASLSLALLLGCSSKNEPQQTLTPEADTAPAEDTAPWNTYPEGPYGLEKDNIFPPLEWDGYRDGTGEWTRIKMLDYYDPTGERGIHALLFIVSAEWCPPCKEEAKDLPGFYTNIYQPRGAKFITAMIEDSKKQPATQAVVDRWVRTYSINFDIVAAPAAEEVLPASSGIPRNYIINTRNMQIVRVNQGVNPDATRVPGLTALLDYNGAPPGPDAGAATDAATTD